MPLHQAIERGWIASLIALLEEEQKKYEDTERVSQHAVYKPSALQESVVEENKQRFLAPPGGGGAFLCRHQSDEGPRAVGERIEKYKREVELPELLRLKLELKNEPSAENAHWENHSALENLKVESEIRLSERFHEKVLRSKEIEGAMDEDRYSIRLEMKHARFLPANTGSAVVFAGLRAPPPPHDESDFSFATLNEVHVRMRLEQLRSRRVEALKRVSLTRHSKLEQASEDLFCHWRIQTTDGGILKLNAVLHMHRVVPHVTLRKKRSFFND